MGVIYDTVSEQVAQHLYALRREGRWDEAQVMLRAMMTEPSTAVQGWAHLQYALTLEMAHGDLDEALASLDTALDLLPVTHEYYVQGLLNGMMIARRTADPHPRERYVTGLLWGLKQTAPLIAQWHGRCHVALCEHYRSQGRMDDALRHAQMAVSFHAESEGPYGGTDRQNMLIHSYIMLADTLMDVGQVDDARERYRLALEIAHTCPRHMQYYLKGRLLLLYGAVALAVEALTSSLREAERKGVGYYQGRCHELLMGAALQRP